MTASETKTRYEQTTEIIEFLSVSQCSGLLAISSRPHSEGGCYLVTERVDALAVARVELVTRSWAVSPGKRDRFISCERDPGDPVTIIIPLRLVNGYLASYVSDTSYLGMCRVGEDPYRVILANAELASLAEWRQPPSEAQR